MPLTPDEDPEVERAGFELLPYVHKDMVEAVAFNEYGDRFASSSADGKIKVHNRHKDGAWHLCDTWGAHSSEILELQWLPPTLHPNLLASIGIDGKFKLWVEDPTLPPRKGRRFNSLSNRPVWQTRSANRSPFLSFSIKHNPDTRHTYLALLDAHAQLTVYENEETENMESWTAVDTFNVCEKPDRGEETTMKVMFDPNIEPCYSAVNAGVPRDALGLVVASMQKASIWRTKEVTSSTITGASSSREFYLAAELKGHRGLVRDVAWAEGSVRGWDVVATACKDGFVRVWQVSTPVLSKKKALDGTDGHAPGEKKAADHGGKTAPSGIAAGLVPARSRTRQQEAQGRDGAVVHAVKEVSKLTADHTPVWRVRMDHDGQLIGSTGDDGKLVMWRREPSGVWSKSSELAMTRATI